MIKHLLTWLIHRLADRRVVLFCVIMLAAASLRIYGYDWDKGGHLHPDERMLIMVAQRLMSPDNTNPDFFNYGTLPIYLLVKVARTITELQPESLAGTYDGLLYVGRSLSIVMDLGTICLVFLIARHLFGKTSIRPYFAMMFYSLSFFAIQNTHFFVVDVFMTFFVTTAIYFFLRYCASDRWYDLLFTSLCLGAAFATKFTALVFFGGFLLALAVWMRAKRKSLTYVLIQMGIVIGVFIVVHMASMPYAYRFAEVLPHTLPFDSAATPSDAIRARLSLLRLGQNSTVATLPIPTPLLDAVGQIFSRRYIMDTLEQAQMNTNAYVFPYTLQYVGTIPYLYYLKNIVLWGFGPAISIYIVIGLFRATTLLYRAYRPRSDIRTYLRRLQIYMPILCVSLIYLIYFLVVGKSAVKFMRYMLPLYPILAVAAGAGFAYLLGQRPIIKRLALGSFLIAVLWTLGFTNIYSVEHTRTRARAWAHQHIPAGSVLAVEHWDDRPIDGPPYQYEEMALYEHDTREKWDLHYRKLERADYIILASNRLYAPLQRLVDCKTYERCFPYAATYYQKLFAGEPVTPLGTRFRLVNESTAYPHLTLGPLTVTIPDDEADESFTVYDHPKVMIFEKIR